MTTVRCRSCHKDVEPLVTLLPETSIHYAEVRCSICHSWLGFKAKPKNEEKLEKRPNGAPTPEDLRIDYCQICLRPREWLGVRETLETHHIDDDPQNNDRLNHLIVCTACHKWIAWVRLYFNDHLKHYYGAER